jgi:hypothetical protein
VTYRVDAGGAAGPRHRGELTPADRVYGPATRELRRSRATLFRFLYDQMAGESSVVLQAIAS